MDSRVGSLTAKMDSVKGQLGAIIEFMKEIQNMMRTNIHSKNAEAGTSSPATMEVQSATPHVVPPMVGDDREREKSPDLVETTTTVASIREQVCNWRLEISIFAGEDPFGWLARTERYFLINGITNKDKIQSVMVCLE